MIEPRAGVIFTLNHVSEAISKLAICLSSCHDEVAGFLKAATFLGEVGDKIGMVGKAGHVRHFHPKHQESE